MNKEWQTYEEVATYLLNQIAEEFNLSRFEGKQKVIGKRSGTEWEIDAKGIKESDEMFIIVECRRYTKSKQTQEKIGALAYRIMDTEAAGCIIVSPLGLQEGAEKVAKAEKIHSVILNKNCTTKNYILEFLNKIRIGFSDKVEISDSLSITIFENGKEVKYDPYNELKLLEKNPH